MADEETNVVVAVDEDGNEVELEVVTELEVDGQFYAVLVPAGQDACECGEDHDEETECIICRIEGDDDDQNLVEVEDEDEYEKVMEALDALYADDMLEGEDDEDDEDDDEDEDDAEKKEDGE